MSVRLANLRILSAVAGAGAVAYAANEHNLNSNPQHPYKKPSYWKALFGGVALRQAAVSDRSESDYQAVYNDIAEKIREEDDADDGAGRYGLLVRLAWHALGTFAKKTGKGGSYGGTMIYSPELSDGGNAGLEVGRDFLYEFAVKYPWLLRGDLWTLSGVAAVQEAGGPKVGWRPGRVDSVDKKDVPANGFLPDGSQGASHVRTVFTRMGFTDQETVALIGAHCLGKCHTWRLGYDGPWGPSFNMFTNDFFVRLLQGWHVRKWDGPKQYQDDETNSFMMLPADIALKEDSQFLVWVKKYAADQDLFFKDFSAAYQKLLENGADFSKTKTIYFKTLDEQEE